MRDVGAGDPSAVDLFKLVAVNRVLQEKSEVREDIKRVVISVYIRLGEGSIVARVLKLSIEA